MAGDINETPITTGPACMSEPKRKEKEDIFEMVSMRHYFAVGFEVKYMNSVSWGKML